MFVVVINKPNTNFDYVIIVVNLNILIFIASIYIANLQKLKVSSKRYM